jgi:hypothetical protein
MTIFTALTKYNVNDIRPFVESLEQSGYSDRKIAIVYEVTDDVISYLKSKGWELYKSELQEHIILQRFLDARQILQTLDNDVVLWVDIKDIIFQQNPIHMFPVVGGIYAYSECIKLEDDPWAVVNSGTTFPTEWNWNKSNISYCAGVMGGLANYMADLFIEIYQWSRANVNQSQLADQAAYNILIRLEHFKKVIDFVPQNTGYVTHLGSVMANKNLIPHLTEDPPIFDGNYVINSKTKQPFIVVHQYDRIPELKLHFETKYK